MVGHIKLDRKILNWEWYQDINVCRVFIHLLLTANYKDGTWQRVKVGRGQVVIGTDKLAKTLRLSRQIIRTTISTLKSTNEITTKPTNKYTLITICKYDIYQSVKNEFNQQYNQQTNQPLTNNLTTNNNSNNDNKVFMNMPLAENFNGLPEIKSGAAIELLKITKQIDASHEQINGLWNVFKIQHLTGKKPYKDDDEVYSHFINWVKDKRIDIKKTIEQNKSNKNTWM